MFRNLAVVVAVVIFSDVCLADLIIDVRGTVGSGNTTWQFAGDYFVPEFGPPSSNNFYSITSPYQLNSRLNTFVSSASGLFDGDFWSTASNTTIGSTFAFSQSAATITGSVTGLHSIDGIFLDDDQSFGDDDFGWFAPGVFFPPGGETLSFSGTATLNVDITAFGEGPTAITQGGDSFMVSLDNLTPFQIPDRLQITFSATAVPEPGTLLTTSLTSIAILLRLRRRPKPQL